MGLLDFLFGLLFLALGVYGGYCTVYRWWGGYLGFKIFEPLYGAYFGVAQASLFVLWIAYSGALSGSIFMLLSFALIPFGVLGTVMWGFGMAMEAGVRLVEPSVPPLERTFDKADGFMARGQFAEAEELYRAALNEEPLHLEALLKMCRALASAGNVEEAVRELSAAHRSTIDHRKDKGPASQHWEGRLLSITYALGDLISVKLNDVERTRNLYETTLEFLYGYHDANPLRTRLKVLAQDTGPLEFFALRSVCQFRGEVGCQLRVRRTARLAKDSKDKTATGRALNAASLLSLPYLLSLLSFERRKHPHKISAHFFLDLRRDMLTRSRL